SAEIARADMVNLYKSWLKSAGVITPPDIQVEISPRFALNKEELSAKLKDKNITIQGDLYLGL
ncbi:MAG: UDPGP type 1 family protein, partial [Proteobacteria bacterium]|nr:UDPGP type 1 family protein [Pseudomonadota bacterium]